MIGSVDDSLSALIDIEVSPDGVGTTQALQVWVDTAFNGSLVLPRPLIETLGLRSASRTEAAD